MLTDNLLLWFNIPKNLSRGCSLQGSKTIKWEECLHNRWPLLFVPIPLQQKYSCTKVLVHSALITFPSRPSSRRTSPRNVTHFYVTRKPLVFFHRIISSLGVFSHYGIKQKSGAYKQNVWQWRQIEELWKTPGEGLCSLRKEVESGRLLFQLTPVHVDRQAVSGLQHGHHEKQDETFQKALFLGLGLTGKLKDGMEKSRTLESRYKPRVCHFIGKRPLASQFNFFSYQFCWMQVRISAYHRGDGECYMKHWNGWNTEICKMGGKSWELDNC